MRTLEVHLPDKLADELQAYSERLEELLQLGLQQVKIGEALSLYERGLVSIGRAAEIAGVPREQLTRQARAAGVTPRWNEQTVREELA